MPLLAVGSNGSGQLGIGHKEDVSLPTKCVFTPDTVVQDDAIASIVAGGNHSLVITDSKMVYCSGHIVDGRCGTDENLNSTGTDGGCITSFHSQFPLQNGKSSNTPLMFAATWESSSFVTADGKSIMTSGQGSKGELGQGRSITLATGPHRILNLTDTDACVISIASSMSHTVAVLSNGTVYGWGVGRKGQLGGAKENAWEPRIIPDIPFKPVRAVCGREFTYLVSAPEDGQHVVFGSDKWGVRSNAPPSIRGWKEIGSSWGGIYVLLETGELLGWGRDDHGQLPPKELPKIQSFSAGSEHVAAITDDQQVIAWGWGEHGNCGEPTGDEGDVFGRWNELEVGGKPKSVWCGCATTWIYTDEP